MNINVDKLVIGSSLEALLFAFYGKHKCLYTRVLKPDIYDKLEDYGLGTSKLDAWNKIAFQLGMGGYLPFENKIKHIKYIDANNIKIVTHEEHIYTITFNKLYVFDDHNFYDLPPSLSCTNDEIRVVDWFHAQRGSQHDHDLYESGNRFMNQVIFFKNSLRSDGKRKDVCVVSYLSNKTLHKYPEHLVRIKTEGVMHQLGIHKNPIYKASVVLVHVRRDIYEYGKNIYNNFDNVEFIYDDAKFIYEINQRRVKIDYMKYLRLKLGL